MNPKQKGNAFEREVAKKISLAISKNKEKNHFRRTKLSGGLEEAGDIVGATKIGIDFCNDYIIETKSLSTKFGYNITTPLLENKENKFIKIIRNLLAEKKAKKKKYFLFILRIKFIGDFLFTDNKKLMISNDYINLRCYKKNILGIGFDRFLKYLYENKIKI